MLATVRQQLGDNCIVFENFTASIGDLMVANLVYWRRIRLSGTVKTVLISHIWDKEKLTLQG
jgi:hypothetical protein